MSASSVEDDDLSAIEAAFEAARSGDIPVIEAPRLIRERTVEIMRSALNSGYNQYFAEADRDLGMALAALDDEPTLGNLASAEIAFVVYRSAAPHRRAREPLATVP